MKIKKILLAIAMMPTLLMAQPYSLDLKTNQPFNQPQGVPSSNCGSQINTISNCGFETGDYTNWILTDLTTPFNPLSVVNGGQSLGFGFFTTAPTEGTFAAFNGFDGDGPGAIEVAQDVTLPATAEQLSFDYRGAWDMSFGATIDRTFEVQIQPSGGGTPMQTSTILTTAPVGSIVVDTGDMSGLVNVAPFAGQSVRVAFVWNVPETNTGPGQFQLDNVAIVGPPPRIPTLSFYGLLIAIMVLMAFGVNRLYRR